MNVTTIANRNQASFAFLLLIFVKHKVFFTRNLHESIYVEFWAIRRLLKRNECFKVTRNKVKQSDARSISLICF